MKSISVAAAAAALVYAPAYAQEAGPDPAPAAAPAAKNFRVALAYSTVSDEYSDDNFRGVTGRATYFFSKHFGVEAEYTTGLDSVDIPGSITLDINGQQVMVNSLEVELDHHAAAFVAGRLPFGTSTEVTGRVGYGWGREKLSGQAVPTPVPTPIPSPPPPPPPAPSSAAPPGLGGHAAGAQSLTPQAVSFSGTLAKLDGFAAGLGLNYFFSEHLGVGFDVTHYFVEDDFYEDGIDIISASLIARF